jgi:hypothetical protein
VEFEDLRMDSVNGTHGLISSYCNIVYITTSLILLFSKELTTFQQLTLRLSKTTEKKLTFYQILLWQNFSPFPSSPTSPPLHNMPKDFSEIERETIAREYGREVKWLDDIYDAGSAPWVKPPKDWFPAEPEDFGYDEIDPEADEKERRAWAISVKRWKNEKFGSRP